MFLPNTALGRRKRFRPDASMTAKVSKRTRVGYGLRERLLLSFIAISDRGDTTR
jgi:hypothetical protein